jgi:hypothetical protein
MTTLSKIVTRKTAKVVQGRAVILSVGPLGSQADARLGLRLSGQRTIYTALLSDLWRTLALWHGQKLAAAKRNARKAGIPWRIAKKQFNASNSL